MNVMISPETIVQSQAALSSALGRVPGASFGEAPLPGRELDAGMGVAVARRTVFRAEDGEDFGRVADRVAAGNMSLLPVGTHTERARLRNAIATGALITSGRHLQHGDAEQATRNMEVFTNCATAAASFSKFYLLLNGSGVGRSYDDALMAVDWSGAPTLLLHLSKDHPDYPHTDAQLCSLGVDMKVLPWGSDPAAADLSAVRAYVAENFLDSVEAAPEGATVFTIPDSREGWAKALEILEAAAFNGGSQSVLVLDFSDVRRSGAPIRGMQNRPASGPISLMRAFLNVRQHIILALRSGAKMLPWEQALRVDHFFSVEVQVGGARRAARMATKSWSDPEVLKFVRIKSEGGLWTANHSVMVDADFWSLVRGAAGEKAAHAVAVFDEVIRCAFINGEPGFINGDKLEDHRVGTAWDKPVYHDGRDFSSGRYKVDAANELLARASQLAGASRFPMTTNPCGEIALHVTGGYCVIADYAPLLACPVAFDEFFPGEAPAAVSALWDARVEDSVRLGVRFLIRANTMDALYGSEVRRTNRIGIGPTGLHEWAWMRYGLDFNDMLDDAGRGAEFWAHVERLSEAAKDEADAYSAELGLVSPTTVTTVKPAGTTSKLFGLTEGAHLPARKHYLRWVQFKGVRSEAGEYDDGADPLLTSYGDRGYPIKPLKSFQGMTAVGFPTVPLLVRLGLGERTVTANDADPSSQFSYLRLLERHWIGAERGNQVSYTLKIYTDKHDLESFRALVLREQPEIRCCSLLPSRPDHEMGFEYLPEESVSQEDFLDIVRGINAEGTSEAVDLVHLQCASGACPI
jgi:adenosylcobalamin-dependent ribonucleoside-triphosphate reductase